MIEAGRAEHAQIADAVTQLDRVGTRLLGVVLVPRLEPGDLPARPNSRNHLAGYDTDGWIPTPPDALNGPTTKLDVVNPRPTGVLRDGARTGARRERR